MLDAQAEEKVSADKSPQEVISVSSEVEQNTEPAHKTLLTNTHKAVTSSLMGLANQLDSFFGDKRADDEFNRSSIRLSYDYRVRMEKKPEDNTQFRFNLRLPNLEEKFRFSVKKNEAEKLPPDPNAPVGLPPKPEETQELEPWRFRMDSGINVSYPPIVFARARLRKNWTIPFFIQRFTEEFGWVSDQGFIQATTLFYDHQLTENLLFRLFNEENWLLTDKEFTTSHGPSILHNVSDNDALSYNARVQTTVDGPWYVNNYHLGIVYRRNLHQQWLYGEVGPGIDFPKAESFRRAPSILFRIESLFGQR